MTDLAHYPARVSRAVAMELLCIKGAAHFRKVVDANPQMVHRLAGETRARYRTAIIFGLLSGLSNDKPRVMPLGGSGRQNERSTSR